MDIEAIYQEESGRVLATLMGMVGDFDLAEEAVQEMFESRFEKNRGDLESIAPEEEPAARFEEPAGPDLAPRAGA